MCLLRWRSSRTRARSRASPRFWGAEDKTYALAAVKAFADAYRAKFPKAIVRITDSLDELLACYGYPAEHWVHRCTTNPIESAFATVRHRTKITRGPGSKAAGLAMAYKLIMAARYRWRAVSAPPHPVVLIRGSARLVSGKLVERSYDQRAAETAD